MFESNSGGQQESLKRWCIRLSTIVIFMVIVIQIIFVTLSSGSLPSIHKYFRPTSLTYSSNNTIINTTGELDRINKKIIESINIPLVRFTEPDKKMCPILPANLIKQVKIERRALDWGTIQNKYSNLQPGGQYRPKECTSRNRMAIIVPYRNREEHLKIFTNHMHSFLQHQQIDYAIYIIDQALPTKFNRAMLMNIGFAEAQKDTNYTNSEGVTFVRPFECFTFHDVDLLPEDERNMYSCPQNPRHMSAAIDKFKYKLPYAAIFGGVSAFKTADFKTINGFSNKYWGWGGEDDDLYRRVIFRKLQLSRYPLSIARYIMIHHENEKLNKPNPKRMTLLATSNKRIDTDGLNDLKYEIVDKSRRALFTLIKVKIHE